jgi:hypothetical protein
MIETARLLLRPPEESDVDAWTSMLTDPRAARYLGPPFDSRAPVAAHIRTAQERHEADGFGLLAVVRKRDGRVIGRSGFLVWDKRAGRRQLCATLASTPRSKSDGRLPAPTGAWGMRRKRVRRAETTVSQLSSGNGLLL